MSTPNNTGTLFLIPTVLAPETEHAVLSPQIKEVIASTRYLMVENLRTARRFISSLKLGIVIDELTFFELNKDTPPAAIEKFIKPLLQGHDTGIISEAGCPGVADPGAMAVALAHKKKIKVVPLVGPSSILLALMASGFSGQSFIFHGYLPIDKQERNKAIRSMEQYTKQKQQTQIFMETPFRNNALLTDLLNTCHPTSLLCIATNVTAPEEFIASKTIYEWRKKTPDLHKQPTIFLLFA
jgi:16S rRNA (cytidine1402-2'-O)-methyltransferase